MPPNAWHTLHFLETLLKLSRKVQKVSKTHIKLGACHYTHLFGAKLWNIVRSKSTTLTTDVNYLIFYFIFYFSE